MKSLWFSLAFFCISATVSGTDNIPEAVQRAFTQLYPEVNNPLWEMRHEGLVATFRDTEGLKKAFFREDGRWTETRVMMRQEQLPKGVSRFIQEHYKHADITFSGKAYSPNSPLFFPLPPLSAQPLCQRFAVSLRHRYGPSGDRHLMGLQHLDMAQGHDIRAVHLQKGFSRQ